MCVTRFRGALALAIGAAWLAGGASECRAALAKSMGQPISAYSASLFGKKKLTAFQQQTLACDPDEPMAGSTSVQYNPNLVRVTGFQYGPGYMRGFNAPSFFPSGAAVEVATPNGLQLRDLGMYLANPTTGNETGYLQLFYQENGNPKGKFAQPPDEVFLQSNGPDSVDTHRFSFEYRGLLPNPNPPASYRVYADPGGRPSGNTPDFMIGPDGTFSNFNEIQAAQVGGTVGDFDDDGIVNATDIDLVADAIRDNGSVEVFDINGDGLLNMEDFHFEVQGILRTRFGDSDTDGDVDLPDLGNLSSGFQVPGEKRWSRGNFDGDLDVDLPDLGRLATNFEGGPRLAFEQFEALVPEPSVLTLAALGALGLLGCRRSTAQHV